MIELFRRLGLSRLQALLAGLFAACWIAVIVASGVGWNPFELAWDFSNSGAFGDSFAPLSTLMALIAAAGAIGAYRVQSEEISRIRAREEELDQVAQSDRARAISRQESLDRQSQKQMFEGTFFQLLRNLRDLVQGLDLVNVDDRERTQGHDVFRLMLEELRAEVAEDRSVKSVKRVWDSFSEYFRFDINHYFRALYHIVKFVDKSDIQGKYFYIQVLRASLSEGEIALLALNCDYGEGREKFKKLVEKYALLHNLTESEIRFWKLRNKFAKSAFEYQEQFSDFDYI